MCKSIGEMSRVYYFFNLPTTRQPGKFSASILPSVPQLMNFAVKQLLDFIGLTNHAKLIQLKKITI